MNISINPHWAKLKAHGIKTLGHEGFADFLRFAAQSTRNLGPEGMSDHFEFSASVVEMEGKRHAQV